jgi:hypothetical protein
MPHFTAAGPAAKPLKVLIYSINYAPEMIGVGRSTGEIGAYLDENGFDVCMVTTPPHYPGWRAFPPYSALRYAHETRAGVKILRCPMLLREKIHGIWRLLAPLSFALTSAPLCFGKSSRCGLILSCASSRRSLRRRPDFSPGSRAPMPSCMSKILKSTPLSPSVI